MKYLLLLPIQAYWLVPKRARRKCLFVQSCSHHVYEVTYHQGLLKGLQALKARFKQCRPGYVAYEFEGSEWVILADKTVVEKTLTSLK